MKKLLIYTLCLTALIVVFVGCKQNTPQSNGQQNSQQQTENQGQNQSSTEAEKAVSDFLNDLKHENYASAKKYYKENLDNMADFHNQIESISPTVTNKLFSKLTDFTYTIEGSSISPDDSSKATVYVSMEYYDVGKAFETTMLEYIKNEITMTYDGKNDDDIEKKADEIIIEDIESSQKTSAQHIPVSLSFEKDSWKIEKMSSNPELLNILSGNILETINTLISTLNEND